MKKFFLGLLLSLSIFTFVGCSNTPKEQELKTVTLTIANGEEAVSFEGSSSATYLGEVFSNQGIYAGETSEYGLFIQTANGYTVDSSKEEWWKLTKGGEVVPTGIDSTTFKDGDYFELTLTTGYN